MVQTLLNLNKREDMVVNVVKGKFGLSNKNDAIRLIINEYEKESLEPELRPEYCKKLDSAMEQKGVRFRYIKEFDKHFEDV
jgi:hypothetical protein